MTVRRIFSDAPAAASADKIRCFGGDPFLLRDVCRFLEGTLGNRASIITLFCYWLPGSPEDIPIVFIKCNLSRKNKKLLFFREDMLELAENGEEWRVAQYEFLCINDKRALPEWGFCGIVHLISMSRRKRNHRRGNTWWEWWQLEWQRDNKFEKCVWDHGIEQVLDQW